MHLPRDQPQFYLNDVRAQSLLTQYAASPYCCLQFYLNNAGVPGRVVHRLALFDASGQISHVVSQLDVVR